jgi:cysteine dioxygenase
VNNTTTKLQKLTTWLTQNKFEVSAYRAFLASLDLSPTDFQYLYRFSSDAYTRNVLAKTDDYELILICWEAGQMSPIHNHGFSQCFVRCLKGSMCENSYIYQNNEMRFNAAQQVNAGGTTFIDESDVFHEFGNASHTAKAVSLHLYVPKITQHRLFDKNTGVVSDGDF